MADTFQLEVATPERQLVSEPATEAQIPAKNGYLGVVPGHAALLSELTTGFISYTSEGHKRYVVIHGGFLEILNDHVRVLADRAERAEEIDVERARRALKRAQERLESSHLEMDVARALSAMARANTRLEAAQLQKR